MCVVGAGGLAAVTLEEPWPQRATREDVFAGLTTERLCGQQKVLLFLLSLEAGGSGLFFFKTRAEKERCD